MRASRSERPPWRRMRRRCPPRPCCSATTWEAWSPSPPRRAPGPPPWCSWPRSCRAAPRPGTFLQLLLARPVPPPGVRAAAPLCGELAAPLCRAVVASLAPESPRVLREVVRPRTPPAAVAGVPALVVTGDRDPLLPAPAAAAFARALGAEHQSLDGAGHWLFAGPAWQRGVGLVHRWIIQRLGEPLLERYAEAMTEREEDR